MNPADRQELLRSGGITRTLLSLSAPAVTAMFTIGLYNVADTWYIGMLGDTAAIGAAAVLFPVFTLLSAVGLMFGVGSGSAISRLLGAGKGESANRIASTAYFSALAVSIVITTLALIGLKPLLTFFGATPTIMEQAAVYGSIIIGGSTFQIMNMCVNNIIRAEGASAYSGRAMMGGALLNILLDPLFMFVFGFGIAGAALATITSQAVSQAYLLRFFLRRFGVIRISLSHIELSLRNYGEIMKIGVPTLIRQMLTGISMGVMNNAAADFGDWAVAAVGIVLRLISFVLFIIFGIGQGFQPLAGFNYGARQYDRVRKSLLTAVLLSTGVSIFFSLLFLAAAPLLVSSFSGDPTVIAVGSRALRFAAATLMLLGFQNTSGIFFQALGRGRETAFLAASRQGLFLVPLLLILPRFFGIDGIIFSQPAADLLTVFVTVILLTGHLKKLSSEERQWKEGRMSV
jgi:putative MATE family efflux protein